MGGLHGSGLPSLSTIDTKSLQSISASGLLFQENTTGLNSIRLQISGATVGTVVTVFGTVNSIDWVPVGTVVGNNTALFSIQAFQSVKAECTIFDNQTFDLSYKLETHPSAVSLLDKDGFPHSTANPVPVEGELVLTEGGITNASILNVAASASQEYPIVIPSGTKEFLIKTRTTSKFRIAWEAGETSNNYTTISGGAFYNRTNLKIASPLIIYVMTLSDTTLEVQLWN